MLSTTSLEQPAAISSAAVIALVVPVFVVSPFDQSKRPYRSAAEAAPQRHELVNPRRQYALYEGSRGLAFLEFLIEREDSARITSAPARSDNSQRVVRTKCKACEVSSAAI